MSNAIIRKISLPALGAMFKGPGAGRRLMLAALALFSIGCTALSLRLRMPVLMLVPVVSVAALSALYDYRPLFYLMIGSIPLSIQVTFGDSLALDVASEPLMIFFLALWLLLGISGKLFDRQAKVNPWQVWMVLIVAWTLLCTLNSTYPERSLKFLLSRLWYVAAFGFMAWHILRRLPDLRRTMWFFVAPASFTAIVISIFHAAEGFSFEASHSISYPLYANHVVYGAALALAVPLAWYLRATASPGGVQRFIATLCLGTLLLGAALTYARGAWLAVLMLPLLAWAIRQRWFIPALAGALLLLTLALSYLVQDNRFYRFAPEFDETIFHEGDLSGHLSATFEGKEMSGMERFYRWVAAGNMIAAKPWLGFGPSTFNQNYQRYADDAFRTYVSDNEEQSTTHNYFLMTFAEQGVPGGLLFLLFFVFMVGRGAWLVQNASSPQLRLTALALTLSLCTIALHTLLNELIEVDKVGAFFWLNTAMVERCAQLNTTETGAEQVL